MVRTENKKKELRIQAQNQKAITLIALVITIIILLILAGISIVSLTGSGLFDKAKEAKQQSENAQREENETLENYIAQINEVTGEASEGNQSKKITNVDTSKTNPEAAKPSGAIVIEGDANKGIVIKDNKDNEWVWVEVPKDVTKDATTDSEIETALQTYAVDYRGSFTDEWYAKDGSTLVTASTSGLTDNQKTLNNGCGLTYDEYNSKKSKMLQSIKADGGFWISRYEIGDETATASNTERTSSSGTTGIAVSKVNQIPYGYVTCSQAQTLASGMSTDSNKTSSLLFGIQWDLVCKFLEVKGDWASNNGLNYIRSNSASWGNYNNSTVTNIRTGAKQLISSVWTETSDDKPPYGMGIFLTTGASEYTNKMNIYDFAGNAGELTLEKGSSTDQPCVRRGGVFNGWGSDFPASNRSCYYINQSELNYAFRSTLY